MGILVAIVFSQFAGTSLWFAGNALIEHIPGLSRLPDQTIAAISSAVQFGFILGTLTFALFTLADRVAPRRLFFICSVAGAASNLLLFLDPDNHRWLVASRFLTGFFLAGIYPVGMRIAAGWYARGLGRAIGYLVGALVLGSAFPFLLSGFASVVSWQSSLVVVSAFALCGGMVMLWLVADGPHLRSGGRFEPGAMVRVFRSPQFRASAFGYFGHMWELYAFWVFLPIFLDNHLQLVGSSALNAPLWIFLVIASGALGCAVGGHVSTRIGSARVAACQLSVSGLCCLLSPALYFLPTPFFLAFLLLWGITVVGDSPQFSTLNAQTAPRDLVGSALTIANCIGFAVSILSILLLGYLNSLVAPHLLLIALLPGPVFGLFAMRRSLSTGTSSTHQTR